MTVHPYAGGGGGSQFEARVATTVVAEMILGDRSRLGGMVDEVQLQDGPPGFDDIRVSLELPEGSPRALFVQCRRTQPAVASDKKFQELLTRAVAAIDAERASFDIGSSRLCLIVSPRSRGTRSIEDVCRLAKATSSLDAFVEAVEAHRGQSAERWTHCLRAGAATGLDQAAVYAVLRNLSVHEFQVEEDSDRDWLDVHNRLARAFPTGGQARSDALLRAVLKFVGEQSKVAGSIRMDNLRSELSARLPPQSPNTRRDRLHREKLTSAGRIAARLESLTVEPIMAAELAADILAMPNQVDVEPGLTLVTGPIGIGKTTELERLHCRAVDDVLEDPTRPIPVLLRAVDLRTTLIAATQVEAEAFGDPASSGVHLVVDGLDEAGIRVEDFVVDATALAAKWPNSVVVASTRPQSDTLPGVRTIDLEPLTSAEAGKLIDRLTGEGERLPRQRLALAELLRRPLFAIRYGLNRSLGQGERIREAHLINDIGTAAMREAGDADDLYEVFVHLASELMDSGGRPVPGDRLGLSPPQLNRLVASRITAGSAARITFQLAVLTEWFAGSGLLQNEELLNHSLDTPERAEKWRYAFAAALARANPTQTDRIMEQLLTKAPGTASWVFDEIAQVGPAPADDGDWTVAEITDLGRRLHQALTSWTSGWSDLTAFWEPFGLSPSVGWHVSDRSVTTAWKRRAAGAEPVTTQLDAHVNPFTTTLDWDRLQVGPATDLVLLPWGRARAVFRSGVESLLQSRALLRDVQVCWPELCWEYANYLVGRRGQVDSTTVPVDELQRRVHDVRAHTPEGECAVFQSGRTWQVTEAESFIAMLQAHGVEHVQNPWPCADRRAQQTWNWWSTDQILARARLTTKAGLDAYTAIVDQHLPHMAAQLSTYQLLPARVVGVLTPAMGDEATGDRPQFSWSLEPLPDGSPNESDWTIGEASWDPPEHEWRARQHRLHKLRGDKSSLVRLASHGGDPSLFDATPAGNLALNLLVSDLRDLKLASSPISFRGSQQPVVPTGAGTTS